MLGGGAGKARSKENWANYLLDPAFKTQVAQIFWRHTFLATLWPYVWHLCPWWCSFWSILDFFKKINRKTILIFLSEDLKFSFRNRWHELNFPVPWLVWDFLTLASFNFNKLKTWEGWYDNHYHQRRVWFRSFSLAYLRFGMLNVQSLTWKLGLILFRLLSALNKNFRSGSR